MLGVNYIKAEQSCIVDRNRVNFTNFRLVHMVSLATIQFLYRYKRKQ